MKNISRLVGIAALAALPAFAQAQGTSTSRPVSFGVSGGASIPVGDLSDGVDVGYNLGAHVLLSPASLSMLSFRGDVSLDSWKFKNSSKASLRALDVMANAIVKSGSAMAIKPYAIGGLGLVNSKASATSTTVGGVTVTVDSKSESNFGIQAGGGLEFQLSGFTTFLEAKFVNAFGDNSSSRWVPVTFGIRF